MDLEPIIDELIDDYKKLSISSIYPRPRIGFVDWVPPFNMAIAQAIVALDYMSEKNKIYNEEFGNELRNLLFDRANLSLSDKAKKQMQEVSFKISVSKLNMEDENLLRARESGYDIVIFNSAIPELLKYTPNLDAALYLTVGHEIWHVIELRAKVLDFMGEATAMFAQESLKNLKYGEKTEIKISPENEDFETFYLDLNYTLPYLWIKDETNDLNQILDDKFRQSLRETYADKRRDYFLLTSDGSGHRGVKAATLKMSPQYLEMNGNLNSSTILSVMHKIGYTLAAEELKKQDLSLLIERYKRIGF